jgi:hypothetical protein
VQARSVAAEAFYFLLDQKVTKNQVGHNASLRSGPLRCKSGKTWAANFCPTFVLTYPPLLQSLLCPAAAPPTIVLPDFARSCSADEEGGLVTTSKIFAGARAFAQLPLGCYFVLIGDYISVRPLGVIASHFSSELSLDMKSV